MAGKKGSRSSKTDHVLSLLSSGGKEEEHGMEETQQVQPEAASKEAQTVSAQEEKTPVLEEQASQEEMEREQAPVQTKQVRTVSSTRREGERLTAPILQVARTNHEALSETIRGALNQALEEEIAQTHPEQARVPEAEPIPVLEPVAEPEPAPEPEPEPVPEPKPAPKSEPVFEPEPSSAPKAAPQTQPEVPFLPREVKLPDGSVCVNVMELLVDERLERYVQMFGLCTCPRCLADARALALTQLPSKYVVLDSDTATPMLSLYRAKFESMVIAQVMQACRLVTESPRHVL